MVGGRSCDLSKFREVALSAVCDIAVSSRLLAVIKIKRGESCCAKPRTYVVHRVALSRDPESSEGRYVGCSRLVSRVELLTATCPHQAPIAWCRPLQICL